MNMDSTYLKQLQQKKWQIKETKDSLGKALSIRPEAERKKEELLRFRDNERKEAESAENGNLMTFIYGIFGKKDQLVEEERKEAYEAENAYNSAVYEFNLIQADILDYERKLADLLKAEEEFDILLAEKKKTVSETQPLKASEIASYEKEMLIKKDILARHEAALLEGNNVLEMTDELIVLMKEAEYWAHQCTVGGDVKATWEEKDNRNNALHHASVLAEKTKMQSDSFNDSLKNTDIQKEITFDLSVFDFKDPDNEPFFYGNSGLYSDTEYAHRCTVAYKDIILPVIEKLKEMVSFMTEEYENALKDYENVIIDS